jgi:hypothetical protein
MTTSTAPKIRYRASWTWAGSDRKTSGIIWMIAAPTSAPAMLPSPPSTTPARIVIDVMNRNDSGEMNPTRDA